MKNVSVLSDAENNKRSKNKKPRKENKSNMRSKKKGRKNSIDSKKDSLMNSKIKSRKNEDLSITAVAPSQIIQPMYNLMPVGYQNVTLLNSSMVP